MPDYTDLKRRLCLVGSISLPQDAKASAEAIDRLERELATLNQNLDPNDPSEHKGHCAQAVHIVYRMMNWPTPERYPHVVDALVGAEIELAGGVKPFMQLAEARKDSERLNILARHLLDDGDYFDYREIDRFDLEDYLKQAGLIEDGTVTQKDLEDDWAAEYDLSIGDHCLRITKRGRAAIDSAREDTPR